MQGSYRLTSDPVFYWMGSFFALLTTALPAVLGQVRFMPLGQTVVLSIFVVLAVRRRDLRGALGVVLLWLVVSMAALIVLMGVAPAQIERAFDDGFFYRASLSEWYFAGSPLPGSLATQPLASLLEVAGLTVGALVSGGVVGVWSLVRLANLTAFGAGHLLGVLGSPLWLPVALAPWHLLQLAGASGLVVLLAEPLWVVRGVTGSWFRRRRRWLWFALLLYLAGVVAEALLPAFWRFHR